MEPARFDDTFVAGNSYPMTLTLDEDVLQGSAVLVIRHSFTEPVILAVNAVMLTEGRITFNLTPEQTLKLNNARKGFNKFSYSVQYTNSQDFVQTLLIGQLRVLRALST